MDTSAIVMMVIAMVTVWGGLIAAIMHLRKHPDGE
ncbi:methionine/alanine import family NSS transporter small subunit [Brevibacterium antiquum]|nr:methionine/alanine import family NSS transporter small subunit [Brevibacterium antiquum]